MQTTAVIHAITINVTHEPIEALGSKRDGPAGHAPGLSSLDEGSNVVITLKKGMDNHMQ